MPDNEERDMGIACPCGERFQVPPGGDLQWAVIAARAHRREVHGAD